MSAERQQRYRDRRNALRAGVTAAVTGAVTGVTPAQAPQDAGGGVPYDVVFPSPPAPKTPARATKPPRRAAQGRDEPESRPGWRPEWGEPGRRSGGTARARVMVAAETLDPSDLPTLPGLDVLRDHAIRVLYAVALNPAESGNSRVAGAKAILDVTTSTAQAQSAYGLSSTLQELLGPDDGPDDDAPREQQ